MMTLIDYGLGNLSAFKHVYRRLNIPTRVAQCEADLVDASKLILPGVGSFDYAMKRFNSSGMRPIVEHLVMEKSLPVLGVCVGMQMLAERSAEGSLPGLNWVSGHVEKMAWIKSTMQLPHMGWNEVKPASETRLFSSLTSEVYFYFLHSYVFNCESEENIIAKAYYGQNFVCAVNKNNIYGVQFHPEKSHQFGMQLLKNFADL